MSCGVVSKALIIHAGSSRHSHSSLFVVVVVVMMMMMVMMMMYHQVMPIPTKKADLIYVRDLEVLKKVQRSDHIVNLLAVQHVQRNVPEVGSFAAIDARLLYVAPSHLVCTISGYRR
jgi:hypothetical protein